MSESSGSRAVYRQNARLLEVRNFTPAYMKRWTYRRAYVRMILSEPKFLGCIDNQIFLEGVYMTPGRFSRRREITPVPFHGSIFAYMIPPQREFTPLLYRGENFIISQRNHVNAKRPPVSVWNRFAGRLERVARAFCLRFWITRVFYQHEVYLQVTRYEMTQSWCI